MSSSAASLLTEIDLRHIPAELRPAALRDEAEKVQAGFDLAVGPLLKAVLFRMGTLSDRLLIVAHHLAIDGVSWRILLEDILIGQEQVVRGQPIEFQPKTTSYRDWAKQLTDYGASTDLGRHSDYWNRASSGAGRPLPRDFETGPNEVGSAEVVSVSLGRDETQALLQELPVKLRAQINELLLAGLAQTLRDWSGTRVIALDVEGHGREDLFPGTDISRTVGWFTTLFPLRLELPESEAAEDVLAATKEQWRTVPEHGFGYGVLRYLGEPEVARTLSEAAKPEICLNYLGRLDQDLPGWMVPVLDLEAAGSPRSPRGRRPHVLEISAGIAGGTLLISWIFSRHLHRRADRRTPGAELSEEPAVFRETRA